MRIAPKSFRFGFLAIGLLSFAAMLTTGLTPNVVADDDDRDSGAVFTLSNEKAGNHLLAFGRTARGLLYPVGSVATGGLGTGGGLHNEGALALSSDGDYLFGVNPGSDSISAFSLEGKMPKLVQTVPSGGHLPISVTVHENLLYVLHTGGDDGGTDSITGFWITGHGLRAIPNSSRALSMKSAGPAQIGFSNGGNVLVVTERGTNMISTYQVNPNGTVVGPKVQPSSGKTPFGFGFTPNGKLVVSEANGGGANPGGSTVSLYAVAADGTLTAETSSLHTQQTAACWIAVDPNGKFAYTSNTPAATLTGMSVNQQTGSLSLLNPNGGTTASTGSGSAPTDGAVYRGQVIYILNSGLGQIAAFDIANDGSLHPLDLVFGFPASGTGLVVR